MENETAKRREFIEQQRMHLIWLVAAIGTIGSAFMEYIGTRSKGEKNQQ